MSSTIGFLTFGLSLSHHARKGRRLLARREVGSLRATPFRMTNVLSCRTKCNVTKQLLVRDTVYRLCTSLSHIISNRFFVPEYPPMHHALFFVKRR